MSGPGLGVGGAIIRRREEEDEGKGRRKSPKVEVVTSSRAKMGKLGGRTGIKYPIKKKKRKEKRIHKLEVESESGSASKTAVPVLFNRGEKKQSSLLYYGKYGTSRGSRGLCIYHGRSTENQKSKITTNYSNSTIPLLVPIFPPLTRVRLYSTL